MRRVGVGRAVLYGTLAVGTLDILDAFVFFGLRNGVRPARILQGIAAGVLTRTAALQGGAATAALGLLLHYGIALAIVATYVGVSRRLPVLARRPLLFGPIYGVAVYVVMNTIVVPMSRIGGAFAPAWPVLINGLIIHLCAVGLPSALAAAAVPPQEERLMPSGS